MTECMVLARALGTTVRMRLRSLASGAIVGVMLLTLVNLPSNLQVVLEVVDVLTEISYELARIRELAYLTTRLEVAGPLVVMRPDVPENAVQRLEPHWARSALPALRR